MLVNFAPEGDRKVLIDPLKITATVSLPDDATNIFFGAYVAVVHTPIEEVSRIIKAWKSPTDPQPYVPTREDWLLAKVIGELWDSQFIPNGPSLGPGYIADKAKKICNNL